MAYAQCCSAPEEDEEEGLAAREEREKGPGAEAGRAGPGGPAEGRGQGVHPGLPCGGPELMLSELPFWSLWVGWVEPRPEKEGR